MAILCGIEYTKENVIQAICALTPNKNYPCSYILGT